VRDVLLPPSLVSLTRLVLAASFPWAARAPGTALVVLAMAGLSDVIDGFIARRYGMVTATGAVIDGMTDKIFVLVVVLTLLVQKHLTFGALFLLGVREIGELPLVLWLAASHGARHARVEAPKANALGKAATVMQFATVAALLWGTRHAAVWLVITAALGSLALASYWRRELRVRSTDAPLAGC
jgi:phosphatidylglycerophosphate synthase